MTLKKRANIMARARNVRAVVLGGLGVLFPATVFIDGEHEILRQRSHVDGQGMSFLRSAGFRIAITTAGGGEEPFTNVLTRRMNSLASVKNGTWRPVLLLKNVVRVGRVDAVAHWLQEEGLTWQECAYMGDDMEDYEMMNTVGFPSAPISAEQFIKDMALYVSDRPAGYGAVRDLANFILDAKGIDMRTLALH